MNVRRRCKSVATFHNINNSTDERRVIEEYAHHLSSTPNHNRMHTETIKTSESSFAYQMECAKSSYQHLSYGISPANGISTSKSAMALSITTNNSSKSTHSNFDRRTLVTAL